MNFKDTIQKQVQESLQPLVAPATLEAAVSAVTDKIAAEVAHIMEPVKASIAMFDVEQEAAPEPTKSKRGRPKGTKNKPKPEPKPEKVAERPVDEDEVSEVEILAVEDELPETEDAELEGFFNVEE